MVQIDVFLAGSLGSGLALVARRKLAEEPRLWKNEYLASAIAFTAFFWVPMSLFFLGEWTDWDTMYMWSAGTLPSWLTPGFVLFEMAAAALAFVATHAALRGGRKSLGFAIPLLLLIPVIAISLLGFERVLHVGTVESFQAGGEWNAWTTSLPIALGAVGVYLGVPLALIYKRWSAQA